MTAQPSVFSSIPVGIANSVSESRSDVTSSKMMIGASLISACAQSDPLAPVARAGCSRRVLRKGARPRYQNISEAIDKGGSLPTARPPGSPPTCPAPPQLSDIRRFAILSDLPLKKR